MRSAVLVSLLAIVCLLSCSRTPEDDIYYTHVSGLGKVDYAYVTTTARRNYAEIELGRLALTKATDPRVKIFAEFMVQENTTLQNDLSDKINKNQQQWPVTLPTATESYPAQDIQYLQQFSGYSFDTAYIKNQSRIITPRVGDFESEIREGAILYVVNFATKWLPRIVNHKETIDSLVVQVVR
jgi:putative membrane protein